MPASSINGNGRLFEPWIRAHFPHLRPATTILLNLQATLSFILYCDSLSHLLARLPNAYPHGITVVSSVVCWFSAILALRNHAIGYVMQGFVACMLACLLLLGVTLILVPEFVLAPEVIFVTIGVICLSLVYVKKGIRWIRLGLSRMKNDMRALDPF